jgi:hypothetical protein
MCVLKFGTSSMVSRERFVRRWTSSARKDDKRLKYFRHLERTLARVGGFPRMSDVVAIAFLCALAVGFAFRPLFLPLRLNSMEVPLLFATLARVVRVLVIFRVPFRIS